MTKIYKLAVYATNEYGDNLWSDNDTYFQSVDKANKAAEKRSREICNNESKWETTGNGSAKLDQDTNTVWVEISPINVVV